MRNFTLQSKSVFACFTVHFSRQKNLFRLYHSGLHTHMKKPITKSAALNLCRAAELLQALRAQYKRRWSRLTPLLSIIYQRLQYMALSTLSTVKKRMSSDRRYTAKDLDVLASLEIMMNMFQGTTGIHSVIGL